ncbi:pyruvate, phosphate dikinase [bacterium]|nr:pyruvate, phosphate dikinase [bacterium]
MDKQYVYFFSKEHTDGSSEMKDILGGKGANLAEMSRIGLPVPPGFTISTEVCEYYSAHDNNYPPELEEQVRDAVEKLEKIRERKLEDARKPLLVSVRSGAAVSMPGMMDTVLNLGLNDETVLGLANETNNPRFAWDAYRRFIQMFGDVVLEIPHEKFEHALETVKREFGEKKGIENVESLKQEQLNKVVPDTALGVEELQKLVKRYKVIYEEHDKKFPQDVHEQLWMSISAVFGSWNNERAIKYRQINEIKGLLGTAVNVQSMVFGNMGNDSGTGVGFTRNPSTGENKLYGEYLLDAQGEDVVAGIRTPQPVDKLSEEMPEIHSELLKVKGILEEHYKDVQDFEFTIERAKLLMLQTRTGKRTAQAAVKIAVDMVKEGFIDKKTAVMRVQPKQLEQLLHPTFDSAEENKVDALAKGLPASPGAGTGKVVFDADTAEEWAKNDEKVILVRIETSPEDIGGMAIAQGILTARGGMTSHAAVVARGMGIPCVAGAGDIVVDYAKKQFMVGDTIVKEGDWLSINGARGTVYVGKLPTTEPELAGDFGTIMEWADGFRKIGVQTNADTPKDTAVAVRFGAEGIGLCRTEHMFFEGNRIVSFRRMILVADEVKNLREQLRTENNPDKRMAIELKLKEPLEQYNRAIDELLPLQRDDFSGIFRELKGRPATIRLLDPPLHEFLPHDDKGQQEMAEAMNVSVEKIKRTVESLHEFNPMLGHRGCRLGLTYPEVSDMQVRAIIEAAILVKKEGMQVHPEIMIPLVGHWKELAIARERAEKVIAKVFEETGTKIDYHIGTMIEIPRAAVTADEVAKYADFFSFGTNDLTQMGAGFSRDDAGKFLPDYVKMGIYEHDPFQVLDQSGIGRLMKITVKYGRKANPALKLGICGEHGGEPSSVMFCHRIGLDYVSCSPYRVPIARFAAAHAAILFGEPGLEIKEGELF